MIWKTLAIACTVLAFTTTARAECGADHGTSVSAENPAADTPSQVAASGQAASGSGESAPAVRQ